jgi:hypothetical protein
MIAEARGYEGDPLLAVILAVGRFDVAVAVVAVAAPLYAFWLIARICVVASAWGERPERQSLDQFQYYWTPKRWLFASAGIVSIP